eukprot:TRINITY_DN535_c0_g1_i2.p2 TRINITY_DN535_c0_g1~~TRINITY_DN535_c0_g1_i2.p2  ORF type:complete len:351 (-),score=57.57 TRINITY_DN535_c0_g1_i2:1869-2921(-)
MTTAIIGGGISGISFLKNYISKKKSKKSVRLYEGSNRLGGRISSVDRGFSIDGQDVTVRFNAGAQYFTVSDSVTVSMLQDMIEHDVVREMPSNIGVMNINEPIKLVDNTIKRYVGMAGQADIVNYLVSHIQQPDLHIQVNTRIMDISRENNKWSLYDCNNHLLGLYDNVILSMPPKEASSILNKFHPELSQKTNTVQMDPCVSLLFCTPKNSKLGNLKYSGLFVNNSEIIRWVSKNTCYEIGQELPFDCWVVHTTGVWSSKYIQASNSECTQLILDEVNNLFGALVQPLYIDIVKYENSIPTTVFGEPYIWDEETKLGMCGDWCNTQRVEGALMSGYLLSQQLIKSDHFM